MNIKRKLATLITASTGILLFGVGNGCIVQDTGASAPTFISTQTFNYFPSHGSGLANIGDGYGASHSANHIVPRPLMIHNINAAMPILKSERPALYQDIIDSLKSLAYKIYPGHGQTAAMIRDLDSQTPLGTAPPTGPRVCDGTTNAVLSWLPGNLFLGPFSKQRSWDPGSTFDLWAKDFINVTTFDALYNDMYVKITPNDDKNEANVVKAARFGAALLNHVLSRGNNIYKEEIHGTTSTKWAYLPTDRSGNPKFCLISTVEDGFCPNHA